MAASGTAQLANEVKPLYDGEFYMQVQNQVYWDQFADLRMMMNGQRGSQFIWPIAESLAPNTANLDELADVTPALMTVNQQTITLYEYGGAVEVTKLAVATSYADVYKEAAYMNGYNMAESVDLIVRATFGQGARVVYQNGKASRAALDGFNTAASRISGTFLQRLAIFGRGWKMPVYEDGTLCTVIHPFLHYDLQTDADIKLLSQYQQGDILFNGEVAYWGGLRIIVAPDAKAFYGAGAAATSPVNTTLTASTQPGASTITVASATNINVGSWIAIADTIETGNTWYDTNELALVTSVSGTTIGVAAFDPGPGNNGGLRYAHASGVTVTNNCSVFPIVIIGPNSVTKVASSFTGPFGESVVTGPFDRLGRFLTFGWYLIAGWGRTREAWLFRGECGSSIA
jgi:N4-gp56 family major capsid protein